MLGYVLKAGSLPSTTNTLFYFFNINLFILIGGYTLQYCIGFAIHQHGSATGIRMFPILNPSPSSLRGNGWGDLGEWH